MNFVLHDIFLLCRLWSFTVPNSCGLFTSLEAFGEMFFMPLDSS